MQILSDFLFSKRVVCKVQSIWTSAPVEKYLNENSTLIPSAIAGPVRLMKINFYNNKNQIVL